MSKQSENKKLTDKQEMFCREYLIDLNATQAAIRAGYSENTADVQGSRLLGNVKVQEFLSKLASERRDRVSVDADYVLKQAVKLHERCMQEIKPKIIAGSHVQDEDGNKLFVFDSSGAAKALELIGKHVNVQAFKDKIESDVNLSTKPLTKEQAKTIIDELGE